MVEAIVNKTLEQFQAEEDRKGVVFHGVEQLEPETRYALCLLELNDAVVSDDYGTIGAAINAVTGVVKITLLKDRVTQAEVDMPAQPDAGNPPVSQVPRESLTYRGTIKVKAIPEV